MNKIKDYNIRVYGVLKNDQGEVLLSKESKGTHHFTKFPGGGHELGEGIADCLKREFMEELGLEISIDKHLYTTDFFLASAFDKSQQLISIYYWVSSLNVHLIKNGQTSIDPESERNDHFVWRNIMELDVNELTYPVDKKVAEIILSTHKTSK